MQLFLDWLAKKNRHRSALERRANYGFFAGLVGIISNLILFGLKIVIGVISGSIAIITDAVNNLSDMLSSVVTVIGFKMAEKKPDHDHPYGHERSETIAGFLISMVILFVGLQCATTSFKKILDPVSVSYAPAVYVVLALSIGLKIWQVLFYRRVGQIIDSLTLVATAKDSLNDVYATIAVLVSAVIQNMTGWQLDGYVGLAVAIYILISALTMIRSFISSLLGHQPEDALLAKMTTLLDDSEAILGYHDLMVHQYGPNSIFATVHIELDSGWSLNHAHKVIDKIEHDFWHQQHIHMVCHVDPIDIRSRKSAQIYEAVQAVIGHYQLGLQTHDFHVERLVNSDHLIQFDVIVPDSVKVSDDELLVGINHDLRKILGDVTAEITFDHNYAMHDHTLI